MQCPAVEEHASWKEAQYEQIENETPRMSNKTVFMITAAQIYSIKFWDPEDNHQERPGRITSAGST